MVFKGRVLSVSQLLSQAISNNDKYLLFLSLGVILNQMFKDLLYFVAVNSQSAFLTRELGAGGT